MQFIFECCTSVAASEAILLWKRPQVYVCTCHSRFILVCSMLNLLAGNTDDLHRTLARIMDEHVVVRGYNAQMVSLFLIQEDSVET